MKKGLQLDRVVLLGRTFEEYQRYFALDVASLRGKPILDVASGVSSFCAEAHDQGLDVTAADRIYTLSPDEIEPHCVKDLNYVVQSGEGLDVYRWNFYRNPAYLRQFRERAYRRFLADYRRNTARYVPIELPKLPFPDQQFHLTLISYLLLVYEDQLSYEFHRESIREILRVTSGEARLYPIVTFEARRSKYIDQLRNDFRSFRFEDVQTDFEFLRGSNYYLSIRRA